jgi:urease accessory protein
MHKPEAETDQWVANLSLGFRGRADKTVLATRLHTGPLVVQKAFYPEGNVCHVYLLHPPGGVVGGDELSLTVGVENNGHALLTTPAAGKIYRSDGRVALLIQQFHVRTGSSLEWLPQETIMFSGCQVKMQTRVNLEPDAKFIGWEMFCLGRPASGEVFTQGYVQQRFELWQDNVPLIIDCARLQGGSELLQAMWGMQGFTASGTLLATGVSTDILDLVRKHFAAQDDIVFSATLIESVLVVRALAAQAETVRNRFVAVWQLLRPQQLGRQACKPRIWAT